MFIWLASYPKSGNTFVRSLLSAYFFSKDGNFKFDLLNNIKQFPHLSFFVKLGLDLNDEEKLVQNYIKAQDLFNLKNSTQFLKTHSALLQGFTGPKQTLGAIYIVRDPRKVVISYANHFNISIEKATHQLLSFATLVGINPKDKNRRTVTTHLTSWPLHFKSWKAFDKKRFLLIKFEDLVNDTEETFLKMLKFVHQIIGKQFVTDNQKIKNILKSTSFKNLQKLEKETYFSEKAKYGNISKTFFKDGPNSIEKNVLDEKLRQKIEFYLSKEMSELGYL